MSASESAVIVGTLLEPLDSNDGLPTRFKKHSAAIQISNSISLVQRKLYNCLLFKASDNLLTRSSHVISIKELIDMLQYEGSKNYEFISTNVQALMSTTVTWSLLSKKDKDAFGKSGLVSAIIVKEGMVEYEFSRALCEKLSQPRVYGIIDWTIQNLFNSKYSLALYENAAPYLEAGVSPEIPVETLKELLGAPPNYAYKELNRHCIEPAVDECNKHSDLFIEVEQMKDGRRIYAVKLHVKVNPMRMSQVDEVLKESKDIEDALIQAGMNARKAKNFCSLFSREYLEEKLQVLAEAMASPNGVKNQAAFLVKAIEEDYQLNNKPTAPKVTKAAAEQKISERERREVAERAEEGRLLQEDRKKFDRLADTKKEEILEQFGIYLTGANALLVKSWKNHRMQSALVNAAFVTYLREFHPDVLADK